MYARFHSVNNKTVSFGANLRNDDKRSSHAFHIMQMRGALIAIEGSDRVGKSSQAIKLVESLRHHTHGSHRVELMKFPDRNTPIGHLINEYLRCERQLDDHVIHLLFSANRWEHVSRIRALLSAGTTLVVDRYAYSGAAYSAAKSGMSLDWCKAPDIGLPRPDLVLFMTAPNQVIANRNGFGDEIYEMFDFQQKVNHVYQKLREDNWKIISANKNFEDLHNEMLDVIKETIDSVKQSSEESMKTLWNPNFN